jgi:TolB-like protein
MANFRAVHHWIRTLSCVAVAALAVPLMAAGFAAPGPAIVVYPLVSSAGTPASVGSMIAGTLSAAIAAHGDITVKAAPSDTTQADFLSVARKAGADYYLAGFATEIGSQVSAVEQLVSTKTGIVVWRNTASYNVPDDARPSGEQIHDVIMQLANESFAPVTAAQNAPPPPQQRTRPQGPPPKPVAPLPIPANDAAIPDTPVAPSQAQQSSLSTGPRALVIDFDGAALDLAKHYTPESILRTLARYNMSGSTLDIAPADVASQGIVACAQTGSDLIMTGTIDEAQGDPEFGWSYDATLNLKVYSCRNLRAKPLAFTKSVSNGNLQTAIDITVDQALKDLANTLRTTAAR